MELPKIFLKEIEKIECIILVVKCRYCGYEGRVLIYEKGIRRTILDASMFIENDNEILHNCAKGEIDSAYGICDKTGYFISKDV